MDTDLALKRAVDALMDPEVRAKARQAVSEQIEKLESDPEARERARAAFKTAVARLERDERAADAALGLRAATPPAPTP